jgi:FG-GAP-like repeat
MADDFRGDIHTEGKVAVNGSIDGRIDAAGDHDWFRVFLQAGVKYRFETLVTSSSGISLLSPIMRLYDSNGQYIGLSNDGANDSLNAEFFFEPVVSGSYFVDVEQRDAVQITGTYTLSVTTDDFAAGTSTIGEVVPDKGAVAATIETVGDHDWFKVSLSGAHHFVLRESGASTGAGTLQDPLLSLMGFPPSNGTVETLDPKLIKIAQDDNGGPGRDARIDITTTGRFSSFYLDAGSADRGTGTYTVSITTADALVGPSHALWRNDAGRLVDWNINDGAIASSGDLTFNGTAVRPDSSWSVAEVADFNGDFNADVLWRNTNGTLIEWTMQGSTITSSTELTLNGSAVRPDASWSAVGAGDFNGDGKADLLWRNANGELVSWMMDGPAISASADVRSGGAAARPDASWSVAGIGDFNGDGKADVLWRNANGEVAAWLMSGASIADSGDLKSNGTAVRPDASWSIAGIGDFNGDGNADVLWRNANGALSEWQMNGTAIAASGFITSQGAVVAPNASWHIIQIGDFNGDAQSDILWRNDSGVVTEWQMKGSQIIGTTVPAAGGLDGSWHDQVKPTNLG